MSFKQIKMYSRSPLGKGTSRLSKDSIAFIFINKLNRCKAIPREKA